LPHAKLLCIIRATIAATPVRFKLLIDDTPISQYLNICGIHILSLDVALVVSNYEDTTPSIIEYLYNFSAQSSIRSDPLLTNKETYHCVFLQAAPAVAGCCSCGARGAANGGYADVVAAGEFVKCSAPRAAAGGLFLLCRSKCRGAAHLLPLGLGAAPALGGTGAD